MKRILKSRIFLVLVTTIIVGSVTAYATLELTAESVTYGNTTVKAALDELYNKSKNYILPTGTETITENGTYNIANKEKVNVNVTKGKYGTTTVLKNSGDNNDYVVLDIGFKPNYIILMMDGTATFSGGVATTHTAYHLTNINSTLNYDLYATYGHFYNNNEQYSGSWTSTISSTFTNNKLTVPLNTDYLSGQTCKYIVSM